MNLTILGSQGAIPKINKFSSSHLLEISNTNILIDCGEGTQFQLKRNKIKLSKIEIILISHAHGDHYFGLIGLIATLSLLKREKKLKIYCPTSVLKIIQAHIKFSKLILSYDLQLIGLNSQYSENIFENLFFTIRTIPLKHSVYTNGFIIREKIKKRKLVLDKAVKNKINKIYFNKLTKGINVKNEEGFEIDYRDVTEKGANPKSYAYCSDTCFSENIVHLIRNVDLLYCEATFLERDRQRALSTFHSTAKDAAKLALKANAGMLLIGHFSSRYDDYQEFLNESKEIFENVELSEDGKKIDF